MQEFFQELRNNIRLRLGVWLIAAILLIYPIIRLHDYQLALAQEHQQAVQQLQRVKAVSAQDDWPAQAEKIRALRVQAEDKLWRANSKGLAQATLQSWLQEQLKVIAIDKVRLNVEPAVEAANFPELWKVGAKCDGAFNPAQLDNFMKTLLSYPRQLVIERLEIRAQNQFSLVLSAYFQAAPEGEALP